MIRYLERLNHPVRRVLPAVVPVMSVALLAACAPEPVISPGAAAYQDYCAICHGPRAKGDGEIAQRLAVPPPDLTGIAAANGGVFPLRAVADSVYGYSGKHEADLMPEFIALLDGPDVSVSTAAGTTERMPQRLAEMVLYIQSLQRP
ncbi:MAG: c-type cytochrome [Rhodobacterales bacterium]